MVVGTTKVKRLKLSDPMIGVSLHHASPITGVKENVCRVFAENQVNLTFITTRDTHEGNSVFCCLDAGGRSVLANVLKKITTDPAMEHRVFPAVTLLSAFPHQSDLQMMFQLLRALRCSLIPVHAAASSIGALTFVIDTNLAETAVDSLQFVVGTQL
ncbi:MAG: hypothetical protein HKM93_19555 [Desulfobacteraceae bacterium]|nr:hypothetical protein [Desulfobacteraceae bacterium]